MLNHILKIATKNYIRNKSFAFINIFGLSFGLATFILIALFVQYEFSFDKFHKKHERMYGLQPIAHMATGDEYWQQLGYPWGAALKDQFPEIEEVAATRPVWGEYLSTSEKLTFFEENGQFCDQSFFDIFTVEFMEGAAEDALTDPYSIVLTESLRDKFFPDRKALGKYIKANNRYELKVTGVIKDFPKNSTFKIDYLSPIKLIELNGDRPLAEQWDNFSYYIFALLYENSNPEAFSSKIGNFLNNAEVFKDNPTKYTLWANPLKNWHLLVDPSQKGLLIIVYLYSGIAIFALMIACVNFMNLTTAYSVSRAREIGIKKVLGSGRKALSRQFLFESILVALISMHVAFILAEFTMPFFNRIVARDLDIEYYSNWPFIFFIILITLLTGLISGIYPAFFLSGLKPITALKNSSAMSNTRSPLRKILVTFQFFISSAMILSTLIIYKQFVFMKNKELGFDKELVIHAIVDAENKDNSRGFETLETKLKQIPEVQTVAISNTIPFYGSQGTNLSWEGAGPDETINSRYNFISFDFLETFGIELVQGRNFSREVTTDIEEACIINETAVQAFGYESPLGKKIKFWGKDYQVIGVVKDFHPFSVFDKIPPYVFRLHSENVDQWLRHSIKIAPGTNVLAAKEHVTQVYSEFFPNVLFEFQYLGESVDNVAMEVYQGIVNTFLFFSIITIAIAAVGMFGLVAFTTKSRTKEIGIRKVHGASSKQIFILLAREFLIIICIAILLSFPAGIGFRSIDPSAYKPDNEIWEYLVMGVLVMAITFITIFLHTRKASNVNPAESLRYE